MHNGYVHNAAVCASVIQGLLPKEKPRTQTVRDVKKRETERRSRDRFRMSSSDEYPTEELPAGETELDNE